MKDTTTMFPSRVTIEITNACNLNCSVCPRRFMTDPVGFMNFYLWKQIIDEIAHKNITLVPFWRGESLLHPMVKPMLAYTIHKFKEIQFATNGILVEKYLDMVLLFDFVSISYHTEDAVKAVKLLNKYRKNNKPRIQISVVKGETTESKIQDMRKYVDVIRIYDKHSSNGQLGSIGGRENRRFCPKLVTDITIDYTGNVSRCCHNWMTDKPMNVRDNSIQEVWNGDGYQQIRDNYPDEICSACEQWGTKTVGSTEVVNR